MAINASEHADVLAPVPEQDRASVLADADDLAAALAYQPRTAVECAVMRYRREQR